MQKELPSGYRFRLGSWQERELLNNFMELAYQELFPNRQDFTHLPKTVANYLSQDTPIWWVEVRESSSQTSVFKTIACLWMGMALEQSSGDRFAYIFLIYVSPEHRRLGIGKAMMQNATNWAIAKGYPQIGLQVFTQNRIALNLYQKLGFQEESLLLMKDLREDRG
jgi:ribosomal protein S18 acetylase RimI-like enzyme